MEKLIGLEPKAVFEIFEAISKIPRESGNEKGISDFIVKWAKDTGLEVIQEDCLNVIIKKPGSKNREHLAPVIIQGHLDMVCTKSDDFLHDFTKDGIPLKHDGEWLFTEGTTLGADNGIAMAMALAIAFDPNAEHPPLELLFTVSEETGMDGANAVDGSLFSGKTLINLDAEMEGFVEASCAGGINCDLEMDLNQVPSQATGALQITIKGLKGGHSGIEIDKNRSNAIRLMGRLLSAIHKHYPIEIASLSGGEKMNAIAKFAVAKLQFDADAYEGITEIIDQQTKVFQREAELAEPDLRVIVQTTEPLEQVWGKEAAAHWIKLLLLIPNGVQTMSEGIKGLVESSNNMGVLVESDGKIKLINAIRSSVQSLKEELMLRMETLAELTGARVKFYADYPAWPYKPQSPIRDLIMKTYREMYQKEMGIEAIHAGLECGLLIERLGDIDMVSFGPNMESVHTPQERLNIPSTARVFALLKEVLKKIDRI